MTATTSPELKALLQGAKESFDDDAPRLALADWLDANGDPERAQFIRASLEIETAKREYRSAHEAHRTHDRLLAAHRDAWLGPLAECDAAMDVPFEPVTIFTRGLIRLAVRAQEFIEDHVRFMSCPAWDWVEGIHFSGLTPEAVQSLQKIPDFGLLPFLGDGVQVSRDMEFDGQLWDEGLRLLAEWPELARVRSIDLEGHHFTQSAMAPFFRSPHISALRDVTLVNDIRPADALARQLAEADHLVHLRSLKLGTYLGKKGVEWLAGAKHLASLTCLAIELDERQAEISATMLPLLAKAFPNLEHISIHCRKIGAKQVKALAAFPALSEIELRSEMSVPSLRALLQSPLAGRLVSFNMPHITENKAVPGELAQASELTCLRRLAWYGGSLAAGNILGPEGAAELARTTNLDGLTELSLKWHFFGNAGVRALVSSPVWSNLQVLRLPANDIFDEEGLTLAKEAQLPKLEVLELEDSEISDAVAWAIATSPKLPSLRVLEISSPNLSWEMSAIIATWLRDRAPDVAWDSADSPLSDEQKDTVQKAIN